MNSDWFGILQQLFRNDEQGLANRRRIADKFGKYLDDFAQELARPDVPEPEPVEDMPPARDEETKKERLRKAYKIGAALDKPLSMRDDEK